MMVSARDLILASDPVLEALIRERAAAVLDGVIYSVEHAASDVFDYIEKKEVQE